MSKRVRPYIAVVGGGSCSAEVESLAEEVGRLLAEAGCVLVCGGLGGVMAAASRGARATGGTTIGILPGIYPEAANADIEHAICTGMGEARNFFVVMTADGLIALPGEFGTLSEISFALKYKKPVVSLGSWEVSEDILRAESAAAAVEKILDEVGNG
ncbi:MAG: TIGR00725 family protein [bacterium]